MKRRRKNKNKIPNSSNVLVILGNSKEDKKYLNRISEDILKQIEKDCKIYYLSDRIYNNDEKLFKLLKSYFPGIDIRVKTRTTERQWLVFKSLLINDNIKNVYIIGKKNKDFRNFLKGQETNKKPFYRAIPVWDVERTHKVFEYKKLEVRVLES